MRSIFRSALLLAAACLASTPALAPIAHAQTLQPRVTYVPNEFLEGVADLSGTYTNATTTATVLPGTAVSIPATSRDYTKQLFRVCWSADATKATSTTGQVGVAVDGVVNPASYRYTSSAAGRASIGGCYHFYRASQNATVLALYGASADTAALTVNNAQVSYQLWQFN